MNGERAIVISGSRGWEDYDFIRDRLAAMSRPLRVLVGDAAGADNLARRACQELGIPFQVFHADWQMHRKRAGVIRNQLMLAQTGVEMLMAFWIAYSPGTRDAVTRAMRSRLRVELYWRPT